MQPIPTLALDGLEKGAVARVFGFDADAEGLVTKLREIGFAEGDEVELLGRGWLSGAPITVRLNRTAIALRKNEAQLIRVERIR